MTLTSIESVPIGTMVTFRSKNANDTVVWQGTLEGIVTYSVARAYLDPRSYNEAVRQTDNTVSSDVTTLTYFIITVDNQASSPTTLVFADQWISPGSLAEISLGNQVTLIVTDTKNNPQLIVSILANLGYACTIQT